MPPPIIPTPIDNAPIFDLGNAREQRFLLDLIAQEGPGALDDHPMPELYALLRAIERMWGGTDAQEITAPPALIYYLVAYATYAHHIPEDAEVWRASAAHDVYHILQGFMESATLAIKDGAVVQHEDGGVYIDLFRIPQWLYEEVSVEREADDMHHAIRAPGRGGSKA